MMRNNVGFLLLFMVVLTFTAITVGYFYIFQIQVAPKRAIVCKNDGPTISFLINERSQKVIMLGEELSPDSIKIFNETAISAQWRHSDGFTKIFLDRISGELDVETSSEGGEWDKQKFECVSTTLRF
ncbi:MAG: hypothetical protein ACRBDI_03905 [Alphaproteobacteria bacterium]